MPSTAPADVLAFWFGQPGEPGYGQPRREWFAKDAAFDERIRNRFLAGVDAALSGRLAHWMGSPEGVLALLILLDQFPRNLFRNQAKAFAGDRQARLLTEMALDQDWEKQYSPLERVFLYLPFEHSEALADQERAVALFSALAAEHTGNDGFLDYARRHHEVIARFGRFPHRNAALDRDSTPAELDYLAQPGSGF